MAREIGERRIGEGNVDFDEFRTEVLEAWPSLRIPKQKIYLPLCDNGSGGGKLNWVYCMLQAFAGRDVVYERASDSHADRQCNKMANGFLKSDCTDMLIIDADEMFTPKDIERILSHDVPLVCGIYPKKDDDTLPCLDTYGIPIVDRPDGLTEVRWCGRGFMRIRRDLLEMMKEENGGPAARYHNHGQVEWAFFTSGCISGPQSCVPEGQREWVSEDIMFCLRAKTLGIPVLVDSRIALAHEGMKVYRFNPRQVIRTDANINSWRDIHGWFDYEPLYRVLVEHIPDGGRFCEVGAWMGKSVAAFYEFAKEKEKHIEVTVVDTFRGEPDSQDQRNILDSYGGSVEQAFRANMKALGLHPLVYVEDSALAANLIPDAFLPDAVFIDGSHKYEQVCKDIDAWLPKVKEGGILCGHDIDEYGVARAVAERFGGEIEVCGRCWVYQKPVRS